MKIIGLLMASAAMLSAQNRLMEGNPQSPVRVIVYEDLQSPECAAFHTMLNQELLPRFRAKVAFEYRDFPLPKHIWATKAAIAGRFLEGISQGAAFEFRSAVLANQAKITAENFDELWMSFIRSHSIDPVRATVALKDPALASLVEQDYKEGVAHGVARTPTVLVNGEAFVESFPAEEIIKTIELQLSTPKPK